MRPETTALLDGEAILALPNCRLSIADLATIFPTKCSEQRRSTRTGQRRKFVRFFDDERYLPGQTAVWPPANGFATSLICLPTTLILLMFVVPKPRASSLVRLGTFVGSHFMTRDSTVSRATAF